MTHKRGMTNHRKLKKENGIRKSEREKERPTIFPNRKHQRTEAIHQKLKSIQCSKYRFEGKKLLEIVVFSVDVAALHLFYGKWFSEN